MKAILKKVCFVVFMFLLIMCKSTHKNSADLEIKEPTVQFRDDFKSVSGTQKQSFLAEMKATKSSASVLILTKGYKGEDLSVSNEKKVIYKGNPITNLGTGIANYVKIDNTLTTKIKDIYSKQEAVINSETAKKYKFIYVMKEEGFGNSYKITYSNTLRPLK